MGKARDYATAHRIATDRHDYGDRLGCSLGSTDRLGGRGEDHVDVEPHQFCGEIWELVEPTLRVSGPERNVLAFDVTEVAQTVAEGFLTG